jgi:hypothetical protein
LNVFAALANDPAMLRAAKTGAKKPTSKRTAMVSRLKELVNKDQTELKVGSSLAVCFATHFALVA